MEKEIKNIESYDEEIKGEKVLVDFYATWCGPCKMLSPIVAKIAKDHPELNVLRVDVDELPELAARYNVSSIPTLLYIEKGEVVRTTLGYQPEPSLKRFAGLE